MELSQEIKEIQPSVRVNLLSLFYARNGTVSFLLKPSSKIFVSGRFDVIDRQKDAFSNENARLCMWP